MKEKIQERINKVRNLANASVKGNSVGTSSSRVTDSLSSSIRNSKEATIFLAELDAAIKVAQSKKE